MPLRSGNLDTLVRIYRPGPVAREGRSQVAGAGILVKEVPASNEPGAGSERFANAQNVATAPGVFAVRREPALDGVDAMHVLHVVENGAVVAVYDLKSVREHPKDRHWLELAGIRRADHGG